MNTAKKRRKGATGNPRHQRSRETPVAVYVGLLVHDLTGSQTHIDELFRLGLSVSYDRVQDIRRSLAEQICKTFLDTEVVWAYSLPKTTPKPYGFYNANKISKSTSASGIHFGRWMPSLVTPVANLASASVKAKTEFTIAKDDALVKELTMIVLSFVRVEENVLGR